VVTLDAGFATLVMFDAGDKTLQRIFPIHFSSSCREVDAFRCADLCREAFGAGFFEIN
jgi:hypothetical protein